ncbi:MULTISPECIES: amidohydrolase family protein [unclassified Arcicella]|uniref:amidohydrolase family protein n=1 Tax=unclassified Arcicella TaxID=2644986 RepID=UPI002854ECE1|nr:MULTISPECIES: amidohydrolase family protein [unclassified Arcicella]MDR6561609.1 L-fuconolactonase [Arcicella sp. BE51]MDR6812389.1 L-fuconolactonase [Arcicella sp. BE140]MDR6823839.1 L-fuconolactonase [Arcicella sp. BE139]
MTIDAHQHFWQYDAQRHDWISDEMKVIQRDFLPEDLAPILAKNNISGCVAVQADQTLAETDFLIELANKNAFIKAVVGWVDLRADDVDDILEHYAELPIVKGFRHVVQGEADTEFMLRPKFKAGITALGAFDFTYDILIYHYQLEQAIQLAKLFPDQKFVLDHIAKPDIKSGEYTQWQTNIKKLALHQNVYCKLSGMVTEGEWKDWKVADFKIYLDTVVKAFGTERLMYGSDWPVCLVAAEYEEQLGIVNEYFSAFSTLEKKKIMGGNALKFYNI